MSIYPGTAVEQSYAQGFALGREYAEADREAQRPFASGAEELRREALEAYTLGDSAQAERAWKLGIVRGYRESVRTLRPWGWGL